MSDSMFYTICYVPPLFNFILALHPGVVFKTFENNEIYTIIEVCAQGLKQAIYNMRKFGNLNKR